MHDYLTQKTTSGKAFDPRVSVDIGFSSSVAGSSAPTRLQEITKRVQGLRNILANTNDSVQAAVDRLLGERPALELCTAPSPCRGSGDIESLSLALDELESEVSRASGFTFPIGSL